MEVYLTNGRKNRHHPLGFSWTVFFFQSLVPLFRGDWFGFFFLSGAPKILDSLWNGIELRFYYNSNASSYITFLLGALITLPAPFLYNRFLIWRRLRYESYEPFLPEDRELLIQQHYLNEDGEILPPFKIPTRANIFNFLFFVGIIAFIIGFFISIHMVNGSFDPHFEIIHL